MSDPSGFAFVDESVASESSMVTDEPCAAAAFMALATFGADDTGVGFAACVVDAAAGAVADGATTVKLDARTTAPDSSETREIQAERDSVRIGHLSDGDRLPGTRDK